MSHAFALCLLTFLPQPLEAPSGLDGAALVWAIDGAYTTQGSGILLDKRARLLATAWHLVKGKKNLHVLFPLYEDHKLLTAPLPYQDLCKHGKTMRATVLVADPQRDLAILQLDALPAGIRQIAFASDAPRLNDEVAFVGNPQAKNRMWDRAVGKALGVESKSWTFSSGQEVRVQVLEVEAAVGLDTGYSGGPVLNKAGALVGMTIAMRETKAPRIYCVDKDEIRQQLAEAYSTLARTAVWNEDYPTARSLLTKARNCASDDEATAALENAVVYLEDDAQLFLRVALRYVRQTASAFAPAVCASTRGVHP